MENEDKLMYHDIETVKDEVANLLVYYQQAAMATTGKNFPEISKVTPVLLDDDNIYLLLSDLSQHTTNIKTISENVSLYFAGENRHKTEMNNARVTLSGKLELYDNKSDDILSAFERRDRGARMYGKFNDFNVWKFIETHRLYVEGFGKAYK
mgnify:FL=1|jgi:putative heme iron utilization protein